MVEQDETLRETYARYLGEFSLDCTAVSAMPEALSALTEADFRQQPYHLVLIGGMKEGSARMLDLAAYLHESWPGVTYSPAQASKASFRSARSVLCICFSKP